MKRAGRAIFAVAALGMGLLGADAVRADGAQPFYGYSGYFGGPAVYYTADPDVHQTTTPSEGYLGFGTVTYTTGGPFWGYKPVRNYPVSYQRRRHREERVLRVRG